MAGEIGEQLWSNLPVFFNETDPFKMQSSCYFTRIYEGVMGVNLKFLKQKK